jgi:hypothetical protein
MSQLDIFSWQNEAYTSAWQALSEFNFDACNKIVSELLISDVTDNEALLLQRACEYWSEQTKAIETSLPEITDRFIESVISADFSRDYGPQSFRSALLIKGIQSLQKEKRFYSSKGMHIAELYKLLGDLKEAAIQMRYYLDSTDDRPELFAELANYQWQNMQFAEARFNYLKAILLVPEKLIQVPIDNPILSQIISLKGARDAAAWAWLYGEQLPLGRAAECCDVTKNAAAQLCKLVSDAERVRKEAPTRVAVSRKNLHDADATYYAAYFEYLTTGVKRL